MARSSWHAFNFIVAILALILVLVIYYVVYQYKKATSRFARTYRIIDVFPTELTPSLAPLQSGTNTSTTVSHTVYGKEYIKHGSTRPTTLSLSSWPDLEPGTEIIVKNTGSSRLTLAGDSISNVNINDELGPEESGKYIWTGTSFDRIV